MPSAPEDARRARFYPPCLTAPLPTTRVAHANPPASWLSVRWDRRDLSPSFRRKPEFQIRDFSLATGFRQYEECSFYVLTAKGSTQALSFGRFWPPRPPPQ